MTYSQINLTKVRGFLFLTVLILLVGCQENQPPLERTEKYISNCDTWEICDFKETEEVFRCSAVYCPEVYTCWTELRDCQNVPPRGYNCSDCGFMFDTNDNYNYTIKEPVKIHPELRGLFEKQEWVEIGVHLRIDEQYQIKASQSEEERIRIETERRPIFDKMMDDFIATLPESEFNLTAKIISANTFYGNATKETFELIIESDLVEYVGYNFMLKMLGNGVKPNSSQE